jgi:response regulator RpfG family c-di-GMP phosphodiesterase
VTDSLVLGVAVLAVFASGLGAVYRRLQRRSEAVRAKLESLHAARTQHFETTQAGLERSHDLSLEVLEEALAGGTGEAKNRCKRVTAFTIAMGRAMGMSNAEVKVIARGAFLRDVGKMASADKILREFGPLTDDEMATTEEHCYLGYKMLSRIPHLTQSAEIVFAHHERYDGLGYPRGLRGKRIPIGARVVAIAEALDSMIFSHPVRQNEILQSAREEIEMLAGLRFDPEVVSVFLEMPGYLWIDLIKEIEGQNDEFRC